MTTTTSTPVSNRDGGATTGVPVAYRVLVGLTALGVLLQAVWAGIFLEHDKRSETWINVHSNGAHVTTVLAALTALFALVKLRHRKDLLIGSIVLFVAILLESYLGGLITDEHKDSVTAVHIPLAMVITGLVIWLPLRARQTR